MLLVNEETDKWYCSKDDRVYYAKDKRWEGGRSAAWVDPKCRVCQNTMTLVDKDQDRWICKQNNEVYLANYDYWIGDKTRPPPQPTSSDGQYALSLVGGGLMGVAFRALNDYRKSSKYADGKLSQCPQCKKVTRQILVRFSEYPELICEECKNALIEIKGQTFIIPNCETCGMRLRVLDSKNHRWYCKEDGKVFVANAPNS